MGNYFYDVMTPEDRELMCYRPTVNGLLELIEATYADKAAVSDLKVTYTYKELCEHIAHRRAFLNEKNIPLGSNVAVMAPNSIDAMELYLAIMTSGRTVIMLPNALNEQSLFGISKKFELSALFSAEKFLPLSEKLECPVFADTSTSENTAEMADNKKDTTAAIYFTGGTTGAPKGAVLSHGALMRGAFNGTMFPSQNHENRYMALLPLSHIFGSVMGFLSGLYSGACIYACTDMKAAIGSIPIIKPTMLVIVPGLAEIILGLAKMKGAAFLGGSLHTILCGAAPVPPRLMKQFKEFGISLLAGYGLTEGANLTSGNFSVDEKPESMGKIYPEQQTKVVDGELWIKGDNLMKEYYKDPENTAKAFTEDGWFKTGDLVRFDEEGFIFITGRIKNLIILSNGENVSPEEIEELFYKKETVKDCMVSEMEVNTTKVIGIQILPFAPYFAGKSDEEIEAELQKTVDDVNKELPPFKQVRKFTVRKEDFKRTGAMKIARN